MSALPPIATKQRTSSKVAEVPLGDIRALLDHVVG
jgi:hypothetical protein